MKKEIIESLETLAQRCQDILDTARQEIYKSIHESVLNDIEINTKGMFDSDEHLSKFKHLSDKSEFEYLQLIVDIFDPVVNTLECLNGDISIKIELIKHSHVKES